MNLLEIDGVKYEITEALSTQGQQGIVRRGVNVFTKEEVIIKQQNELSEQEKNVLNILKQHKPLDNIIQIKCYQIQKNKVIIVMEHGGQDLQNFLKKHHSNLKKQQLMSIFFQIVYAIKQFHDLGFFHRDLKPENFAITKNCIIKLIDFGTSKIKSDVFQTQSVGTPCYRAPEIHNKAYDSSIDIWSIGCILFELLTNERFYQNKKQLDIQNQDQINERIEKQKLLENPEKQLLIHLIQVDPSQRCNTLQILNYLQGINVQQLIEFDYKKSITIQNLSYEVLETIGRGKNFKIYKGICKQTGEYVAIKSLKTISQCEYQLLSNLNKKKQEHIVEIKSLFQQNNGKTYIVMEIGDYNLFQFMNENFEFKTLQKDQKNRIFQQMVLAVNELHELEYFHKELKLKDFIVFKKDQFGIIKIKLIGLGFRSVESGQTVENFQYKAPEQLDGSKYFDKSVDYWALGCIWFELITGQKLFQGNSNDELTNQIINSTQEEINLRILSQQQFTENEKYLLQQMLRKDRNRVPIKEEIKQFSNPRIFNQSMIIQKFVPVQNSKFSAKWFLPVGQKSIQGAVFNKTQQQKDQELKQKQDEIEKNKQIEFQVKLEQKIIIQKEEIRLEQELIKRQLLNNFNEEQQLIQQHKLTQKLKEILKRNEIGNSGNIDQQQQIEQELKQQNEIESFKQSIEDEQKNQKEEFEKGLQKQQNENLNIILEEKNEELKQNLEQELRDELLIQYNQEVEKREKEQEQDNKRYIEEMKNTILQLIQSTKDLIHNFLLNLEQQGSEELLMEENSTFENQYKQSLQKYRNQTIEKLESVRQDENILKEVNNIDEIEIIEKLKNKYNEDLKQLPMQQNNIQNEINQQFQQYQKQQQKQEEYDNQQKQLNEEFQKIKEEFDLANVQIQIFQQDCQLNFQTIQEYIQKFEVKQFHYKAFQLSQQYDFTQEFLVMVTFQINNISQQQDLRGKNSQYQQLINQQYKINQQFNCLLKDQNQLLKECDEYNKDLRQKTQADAQKFQENLQNFTKKIQNYQNQGTKPHQDLFQRIENSIEQYRSQLQGFHSFLSKNQILIPQEIKIKINELNHIFQEIENLDIKIINYLQEQADIENKLQQLKALGEQYYSEYQNYFKSQEYIFAPFTEYSKINEAIKHQIEMLKQSYNDQLNEFKVVATNFRNQEINKTSDELEQEIQKYKRLLIRFNQRFDQKNQAVQQLLDKLNEIKALQDQNQFKYNHFKLKLNYFEQLLQTIDFDPKFRLYKQLAQSKKQKLEQLENIENYFMKCFSYFDEDQRLYKVFKIKLQNKEKFESLRTQFEGKIEKKFKQSEKCMDDLKKLYEFFRNQKQKIIFKGDELGYQKVIESWEVYQLTQKNGIELAESTNALYQRSINEQSQTDVFLSSISFSLEQLDLLIQDLENIDQDLISQYNQWTQTNNNSLIITTLIIFTVQLYQTNILQQRISKKVSDLTKSQIHQVSQIHPKSVLTRYQDLLEKNKLPEFDIDQLDAELSNFSELMKNVLNDINNRNRVRLRGKIKNQQTIKEIIDLSLFQEFCSIKIHQIIKNKK